MNHPAQPAPEGATDTEIVRLRAEMRAVWDHVQAISPWSESNDMRWSDEISCGLRALETQIADLQEERDSCIELFASIEKLMTNDDGIDPEAWWVEFGPDEAQLIRTLAAKFKEKPLPDYMQNISSVKKCTHGTPEGYYCQKCGGEPKL